MSLAPPPLSTIAAAAAASITNKDDLCSYR
jgi:hypothetical protein